MYEIFANLVDDLVELLAMYPRISAGQANDAFIVENDNQPLGIPHAGRVARLQTFTPHLHDTLQRYFQ